MKILLIGGTDYYSFKAIFRSLYKKSVLIRVISAKFLLPLQPKIG